MRLRLVVLLVASTLGLQACAAPSPSATPTPPRVTSAEPPTATPVTGALPALGATPDSSAAVDAAMAEAASYLGVNRDQLRLEQVEAHDWPDSSLGCPQPDQQYLQVITPGFSVVISSGSHQLEYHTDARGRPRLCRES